MGAYFYRLTRLALALVVLAIMGNAPAYATWAEIKLIKKVAGGTAEKFDFTISGAENEFHVYENNTDTAYPKVTLKPASGIATSRWYKIEAGTNTIAEVLPSGFSLDSVSCEREGGKVYELKDGEWVQKTVAAGAVSLTVSNSAGSFTFASYWKDKITCTITNVTDKPEPPTLIIKKLSKGKIGTFKFSLTGAASRTSSSGGIPDVLIKTKQDSVFESSDTITLTAGALTITEAPSSTFSLESAVCKSGSTVYEPTAAAPRSITMVIPKTGATVCKFVNKYRPPPILIVKKISKDKTGTFKFSLKGTAAGKAGTLPDVSIKTEQKGVGKLSEQITLTAGSLTITEAPSSTFSLESAKCIANSIPYVPTKGSPRSITVVVPATGKVVCIFTNKFTPPPTIIVRKITKGGTGTFKFTGSGTAGSFTHPVITLKENFGVGAPEVKLTGAGDLTITESAVKGYTLTGVDCTIKVKGQSIKTLATKDRKFAQRKVSLSVPKTGNIVCTFTNTYKPEPPTIIVRKISKGRTGTFKFTGSGAAGSFTRPLTTETAGTAKATPAITLKPGKLTITEAKADGFTLDGAVCVDGNDTKISSFNATKRSVTMDVPKTGQVECTFTNSYIPPTVIVRKISKGGTGTFKFSGAGAAGSFTRSVTTETAGTAKATRAIILKPGKLTITEAKADKFTLEGAACVDANDTKISSFNAAKRSVTMDVPKTGEVVCTFTNKYAPPVDPPTIIVRKITKGGTGTFTFSGAGPAGTFEEVSVTTIKVGEAEAAQPITLTRGGELTITEAEVDGYRLIAAGCQIGKKDLHTRINKRRRFIKVTVPKTGQVVCTFTNRRGGGTITIISNFLKRRAEMLTGDTGRPRLVERRRDRYARSSLKDSWGIAGQGTERDGRVSYRTSLSKLGGSLRGSTHEKAARLGVDASQYGGWDEPAVRSGWDIWSEGSWSYFESDGGKAGGTASSGEFGLVRGGVDYLVSPRLLVGVLVQYDYLSERAKHDAATHISGEAGYEISGHGWMAGPYLEYELTKNLFFDVKGLWGTSLNEVSPYRTFTDEFTTTRWLLAARLTGSWRWQDSERSLWHFTPRAEVVWFNEESESFTDSEGFFIESQSVHLGRFKAGPELSYRYMTREGTTIEPRAAVQALWSFARSGDAKGGGLDPATVSGVKDVPLETFQMRFEAGLKIEDQHGQRLELEANYTGLGKEGHEAIGGKVGVTIPLQSKSER